MTRPNVLLICVDQWPAPLMGAAGHQRVLTPTLNEMARNGTMFTNAYSSTPTCIPARRSLMTGTFAPTHGDRVFREREPMDPRLPTLPQVFRDAGYQAYAVGKMHVYPQRDRIGFDDVILNEEGRHHLDNLRDDFELFLDREGFAGQELTHAMGNNAYCTRPWHLSERCHPTNWTTREMCRTIQRRDPTRPGFWYCSYIAPHGPITPPAEYLEMYRHLGVDEPVVGAWAEKFDEIPYALKLHTSKFGPLNPDERILARMGYYAQCTYIDHQMRLLIGTLSEEGLLDDTIVIFTGDHGDMLGNHNLWCKPPMHEWSARIPMIVMDTARYDRLGHGVTDHRLTDIADVMPTLLDMCGIPAPATVEGLSLAGEASRDHVYCEHYEDERAMRMVRAGDHKLIWYPVGNRFQLFDLGADPQECSDLAGSPALSDVEQHLRDLLSARLWGSDERWIHNGDLVGEEEPRFSQRPTRNLASQRGWR